MYLAKDFLQEVKPYNGLLKGMALKLTRSEFASQDLVQDTMHRAISNLDKFQKGTNLKAWLLTIMRNIFINRYRTQKRRNEVVHQSEEVAEYTLTSITSRELPSEFFMLNEVLEQALEQLKDDYKIPFVMHYEGYKYQEIAEKLDIPLGTVKSRIFFARQELIHFLNKEGITSSKVA